MILKHTLETDSLIAPLGLAVDTIDTAEKMLDLYSTVQKKGYKGYFQSFWNLCDLTNLFMLLFCICLRVKFINQVCSTMLEA